MRWQRSARITVKYPPFRALLMFLLTGILLVILFVDIPVVTVVDSSNIGSFPELADLKIPSDSDPKEDVEFVRPNIFLPVNTNEGSNSYGIVQDWRPALGPPEILYIYSAYLDRRRPTPVVRVISIIKRRHKFVECIYYTKNEVVYRGKGKVENMKEAWVLPYLCAYVTCPVPNTDPGDEILKVAVTTDSKTIGTFDDAISIMNLQDRFKIGQLSVCVKPFHYNFNRAVWLVEFIEFYRILGADKFIFYNHTVGPDVEKVLRYYMDRGDVEMHPWTLPVESQKSIRTEAIFASLNDCNLRSVGHYSLTAMVDIDEYIVPRHHSNLIDLVYDIGIYDTYIFKNVFYYLYWENDTAIHDALVDPSIVGGDSLLSQGVEPYLLTQSKTRRLIKTHKHGTRSKYLTRPEKTVQAGNHLVWETIERKKITKNVEDSVGLSHHYRICEFGGFECMKDPSVIDKSAHRFMLPLIKGVADSCLAIFPDEPSCPVAPPLGSPW